MGLAVAGFLFALREAWRGGLRVETAVLVAAVLMVSTLAVPLMFSRDVYNYALYGRIAADGGNPYVETPNDVPDDPFYELSGEKWRDIPSVYGPGFTLLSQGIASARDGMMFQIMAFRFVAVLAGIITALLIAFVAREIAPGRAAFAVVLFGWNPLVVFNAVGGAHNDVLVAAAVIGALALVLIRRELLATAVLTLGLLTKASAAIPLALWLVWAVWRRPDWRERGIEAAKHLGVAALLVVPLVALYWRPENPTLGLVEVSGHEGGFAGVAFVLRVLGGEGCGALCSVVRVAALLVMVGVFVLVARRFARSGASMPLRELGAGWGWALLAAMLLNAFVLPWYLVWVIPLAFVLPRVPRTVVIALGAVMSMFQIVAEPLRGERWYDGMNMVRDWGIRPLVVGGLLVWLLWDLVRRLRGGTPLAEAPREVPTAT